MDRRKALGVFLGVAVGAAGLSLRDRVQSGRVARVAGPLLPDCEGALRELVIHYVPAAAPIVERAYRDFLPQLPADVTVHVVCPDQAAFDDLRSRVGPVPCTLSPVVVGHAITCWSRDRWLALGQVTGGTRVPPVTLLSPRAEDGAELWPARDGDARVGQDLARILGSRVAAERSALHFDGGDFVADAETAFVAPALLARNLQRTVQTAEELEATLVRLLRRRIVLLRDAPDHHAGMFMMPVGDRTVLVADPSLARGLVDCGEPDGTTQRQFDSVAAACSAAGYRVVRIPVVPGRDGRTYLTYVNAILDERDGRRVVYMPIYAHVPALNEAAAAVWRGLGYEVRPVDCSAVYPHFGTLRCLVNVLRRG
ncbi:MAG TPA: agmatine deiminase family protein [Planctomycetota bacterium]|nr:agmatine deiminase family protein [Planctomycetota bacterium]